MNIFFLSYIPELAARAHNDRHVVKMVLESAQMLSAAHRELDGDEQGLLPGEQQVGKAIIGAKCYKLTHVNHPCSKWVRQSEFNYRWLYQLMLELDKERQHRFTPVVGKTIIDLGAFLKHPPKNIPAGEFTPPALAMPDEYKVECPVQSYRNYYQGDKQHLAKWSKRGRPSWFNATV